MQDGVIEQVGTPLELYDHPANEFVATFIGAPSMNLLSAELSNGNLQINDTTWRGPEGSGKVNLGVRPEHLVLSDKGLLMQVKVVEPTGSETLVFLSHEGKDVTAVFRERHTFNPGETLRLMPDPDHLHVFNSETGLRL